MTRFNPGMGHSGGEYSPIFTHDEGGHNAEVRLARVVQRPGSRVEQASAQEDEKHQIDFRGWDKIIGDFKVQFKTIEISMRDKVDLLRRGIVPVTIERDILSAGDHNSLSYQGEHATEYARGSFWAQVEAFAPVAERGGRGERINDEDVKNASNRAEELTPNIEYHGPQSFSP